MTNLLKITCTCSSFTKETNVKVAILPIKSNIKNFIEIFDNGKIIFHKNELNTIINTSYDGIGPSGYHQELKIYCFPENKTKAMKVLLKAMEEFLINIAKYAKKFLEDADKTIENIHITTSELKKRTRSN